MRAGVSVQGVGGTLGQAWRATPGLEKPACVFLLDFYSCLGHIQFASNFYSAGNFNN